MADDELQPPTDLEGATGDPEASEDDAFGALSRVDLQNSGEFADDPTDG